MSRIAFHRPMRALPPPVPTDQVALPAVPQQNAGMNAGSTWMMLALPLMSSITMAAYMVSYGKPLLIGLGLFFVVGSVGVCVMMRQQMRSAQTRAKDQQRERYLGHLNEVRTRAREVAAAQRQAAAWIHPSPPRLWALTAQRRRVWERRAADADFLQLRLGLGRGPLATEIQLQFRPDPLAEYDKRTLRAARRLQERVGTVGRLPALVDLGRAGVISVLGPDGPARSLARSLVCQLAVLHAPDDVGLIVHTGGAPGWEWAKWLPHTHEPGAVGEAGLVPLVAADFAALAEAVEAELERARDARAARRGMTAAEQAAAARRRVVVVFDAFDPAREWTRSAAAAALFEAAGPETGISVVCVVDAEAKEPTRATVRARVGADGALSVEGPRPELFSTVTAAVADRMPAPLAELVARGLAPLQLSPEPDRLLTRTITLSSLLGVEDLADFDPRAAWRAPHDDGVLRLPLGLAADGEPLELDLKESAAGGMGPHGLIVGATGSGKSELLRTLVTGLAMTHSPELLSLVLVDFKGGATFAGLTELPHVAGLITNLADDLSLVDRVRAALHGEQERRQKLLRDAGNVDSLREYQIRRDAGLTDAAGQPLEPLPYLLIIVDEFGELLSQRTDFIDLFVQIGRVGRSLGMHLLLATQRLEEGRLRGLESHLSYRICLRTFSAAESRTVLGSPVAYQLPSIPGSAYLKVDESVLQRFRVAHVSGPYADPAADAQAARTARAVVPFTMRQLPDFPVGDFGGLDGFDGSAGSDGMAEFDEFDESDEFDEFRAPGTSGGPASREASPARARPALPGPTAMAVAAAVLGRHGQPVHQVWLPPLPEVVPLDAVLGPLAAVPGRGWQATLWPGRGRLSFPVGLLDLPLQQRQEPLVLDLAGRHGNLALVGAPQSGKSTVLRTLMLSAMLTHTPQEVRFHGVDFGGGSLAPLAAAPHVGTVAGRRDPQRAARVLTETVRLIAAREQLFAEHGVDSMPVFRSLAAAGRLPAGTDAADVILVLDNWGAVRAELEDADALVVEIAFRGLGVGVHTVLTANRWADIRMNLRDAVSARLELRLNDPAESEVSRQAARTLAGAVPGRGIAAPGLVFHALAPRLDGRDTMAEAGEALDGVLGKLAAAWTGPAAAPVRLLPELVTADRLPEPPGTSRGAVTVGLADRDLEPVTLDLAAGDPHLLVLGDAGAGKSAFLRTLMRGLVARNDGADLRFLIVDYRRSLLDVVGEEYVGAYAGDPAAAAEYVRALADKLATRLPPAGISARALRERAWWSGPEFYVVVDDYDLVGTGPTAPLAPLLDHVAAARDLGLHFVLARRVSGMSRVLTADQLVVRIRDLGTNGLILSGDSREGVLLEGERAGALPPGRGRLLRRREPAALVQLALSDEPGREG